MMVNTNELKSMTLRELDRRIARIHVLGPSPKQLEQLKRQRRLLSNKLYARESRRKKREELERLVEENQSLRRRVQILEEENSRLRVETNLGVSLFTPSLSPCNTLFDEIFPDALF